MAAALPHPPSPVHAIISYFENKVQDYRPRWNLRTAFTTVKDGTTARNRKQEVDEAPVELRRPIAVRATARDVLLVPRSQIIRDKLLGRGAEAEIYLGSLKSTSGEKAARRCIIKKAVTEDAPGCGWRNEFAILRRMDHPNIRRCLGACMEEQTILLEYGVKDLFDVLYTEKRKLSWEEKRAIAKDLAAGLAYVHERGIVHSDVKSENALLTEEGRYQLIDFSMALDLSDREAIKAREGTPVGTYSYMAPEIMRKQPFTTAADIYSLGIIIWELAHHQSPWLEFQDDRIIELVTTVDGRPRIHHSTPDDWAQLIMVCTDPDPARRPSARDLLSVLGQIQFTPSSSPISSLNYTAAKLLKRTPNSYVFKLDLPIAGPDGAPSTAHVAMKETRFDSILIQNEVAVLRRMQHENVVRVLLASVPHCRYVMDYAAHGTLASLLHERPEERLSWEEKRRLALGVARALEHAHGLPGGPVLHTRLSSSAVLLAGEPGAYVPKLSAFSRALDATSELCPRIARLRDSEARQVPPEVAEGRAAWSAPADVFQFGFVLYEIAMRQAPRTSRLLSSDSLAAPRPLSPAPGSPSAAAQADANALPRVALDAMPKDWRTVIHQCWQADPKRRPTARQLRAVFENPDAFGA
eukprot:tig00000241_g20906.t1